MKIQSVHIRNYRKLKNCHIDFDEKKTVLVGANNSGKTSAISAIVWFLKNTDRFTLKEFTATNWAAINEIGEKWLEHDSVDEALLDSHQWDNIVPSMDVWINVEDGEQYRVNHLIPSLSSWDGKKVGVRGQYEPKDVKKLYTVYKDAKIKAKTLEGTEEWEKAGSPDLYPKNLCDFLGKGLNLREYFDVKYYIIDPSLDPDNEDEVQSTPDNEIGNNPLDGLIKVDTILASRDFSDPEGQTDSDIDTLSKQFQQYYKSSGQEDEELTCEGLKLLGGIVTANKTYDEKLKKTFEVPVGELKNINYPGFQNPEIRIRSKIQIEESIKEDGRVALEILKKYSPLLSGQNTEKPYELYLKCREEAIKVANLVNENGTIRVVVDEIIKSQLLTVPDVVRQAYMLSPSDIEDTVEEELRAWVEVMDLPINMVRSYDDYVNHRSQFDTHQGVKGLEFDRVMVIIDDSEIKGFLFSYDKLFGVKDLSNVDLKNKENGKETSIERTQRLFYVTCTRAKNSLAVVMYTNNPERVKTETIRKGWFEENEIIVM